MIINKHILANGLRLVHSQDDSTQMVALNILYNVGARDEHPEHTGFAHLFEHLMFGGSVNIPDYDAPLQLAGGENNAWTNNVSISLTAMWGICCVLLPIKSILINGLLSVKSCRT